MMMHVLIRTVDVLPLVRTAPRLLRPAVDPPRLIIIMVISRVLFARAPVFGPLGTIYVIYEPSMNITDLCIRTIDVLSLVGAVPQLLGRSVDLLHFGLVETDQRAV